jgi:hypothetical protein
MAHLIVVLLLRGRPHGNTQADTRKNNLRADFVNMFSEAYQGVSKHEARLQDFLS